MKLIASDTEKALPSPLSPYEKARGQCSCSPASMCRSVSKWFRSWFVFFCCHVDTLHCFRCVSCNLLLKLFAKIYAKW